MRGLERTDLRHRSFSWACYGVAGVGRNFCVVGEVTSGEVFPEQGPPGSVVIWLERCFLPASVIVFELLTITSRRDPFADDTLRPLYSYSVPKEFNQFSLLLKFVYRCFVPLGTALCFYRNYTSLVLSVFGKRRIYVFFGFGGSLSCSGESTRRLFDKSIDRLFDAGR
jgi:hypothetical protein